MSIMSDKEVYIGKLRVMWGTNVEVEPETNVNTTPTFDGVITDGTDIIPHSITMDSLRYGGLTHFIQVDEKLQDMLKNPDTVTIVDTVRTPEGNFQVIDYVYDCLVEDNKYEIKPDERTVTSLGFKGGDRKRKYKQLQE